MSTTTHRGGTTWLDQNNCSNISPPFYETIFCAYNLGCSHAERQVTLAMLRTIFSPMSTITTRGGTT